MKWAAVGPMIRDVLKTDDLFEKKLSELYDHHEDRQLFQDKFQNDKKVFQETLKKFEKSIFIARTAASSYHFKEIT